MGLKDLDYDALLRYKARFVTRGFQQEHGYDYDEKFAHMAHMTTLRTLIFVILFRHGYVSQLEVKNIFVTLSMP